MKSLKTAGTENRRGLIWISVLAALFAALFLAWPGGSLPVHADDQAVIRKIGSSYYDMQGYRVVTVGTTLELGPAGSVYSNIESVSWQSGDSSIMRISPPRNNLYCRVTALKPGLCTVTGTTASSYSFGAAYDYQYLDSPHKFRVVEAVQSIALEDSRISLAPGGSAKLNWKILPSDPYTEALALEDLTFSSSNPSAVTVDEEGNVKGIAYGTAVITVRSANGAANGIQAACTVTVARPGVTGIRLNKTRATLDAGDTLQLTGTISPRDADEALTWSSSNVSVASVSSSGKVTAKGSGTAKITAKAGSATAVCTVTVRKAPESVKLGNSKVTMTEGAAKTLKATLSPSGSRTSLTWKSSNTKVAEVSDSGRVTAKAKGTATITVTTGNGKKATCKVTVKAPSPKSIKLASKTLKLEIGGKKRLTYTFSPENAQGKVTWKSSKPSVASVNSKGLITAKSVGKTTITARVSSKVTARCTVTVAKKPSSIKLKKTSLTLKRGSTAKLSYSFSPSNSYATVKWSSSSKAVTVKSDGTIAAKSIGRAKITVRTSNGKKASCTVKVTAPDAKSIKLKTTSATVGIGKTLKLSYSLSPSDASGKVKWSTSNKKVAIVNSKGQVTAKASGTATITGKISSKVSAKCKITVPEPVNGIVLTNTPGYIAVGKSISMNVSLTPSNAVETVKWSSSNQSVVSVSSDGTLKGVSEGVSTITAKAGKVSKSFDIVAVKGQVFDISESSVTVYQDKVEYDGKTYASNGRAVIVQSDPEISNEIWMVGGTTVLANVGLNNKNIYTAYEDECGDVVLELMKETENSIINGRICIQGFTYSHTFTIQGKGSLTIDASAVSNAIWGQNIIIKEGTLSLRAHSTLYSVIGNNANANITILSGAKVKAYGGYSAVGGGRYGALEPTNISIAPGSLSYDHDG